MPKRKQIDNKDLIKMIKKESPQPEIMEKFGFKNSTQLKVAYANALMETGEAPEIKGKGRTKKAKPVNTKVAVNGRGSLIIPKALIDNMKIKVGQAFEVKKVASGLQLKNVEKEG
jgi:hypothetical protein